MAPARRMTRSYREVYPLVFLQQGFLDLYISLLKKYEYICHSIIPLSQHHLLYLLTLMQSRQAIDFLYLFYKMQMDKSDSSEEYYDSSDEDIYADEGGGLVESGAVPAHLLETMPHRAIGMITFEHHTKTQLPPSNGTGFLIAPNLVVTVAHVIFEAKENKFYKSIKFTLGSRRANKKTVKVLECKVPEEYMQLHPNKLRSKFSVKYDYSLLKLQQEIILPEYFVLINKFDNDLEKLSVYGYPKFEKEGATVLFGVQNGQQGETQTSILMVDTTLMRIKHSLPTFNGHSGSPILIGDKQVVGIHKSAIHSSDYSKFFNCAVLFNTPMIQQFKQWAKEFNNGKEIKFEVKEYYRQRSLTHSRVLTEEFKEVPLQNMTLIDISHRKKLPMCCVGQLATIYNSETKIYGTAFLISENLLLSCFANIYNPLLEGFDPKSPSVKLVFYPSFQSDRVNSYEVQQFQHNAESMSLKSEGNFKKKAELILEDFTYDFCLLKLKKSIVLPSYLELLVNFQRDGEKYKILGCPTRDSNNMIHQTVAMEGLPVIKSALRIYPDKKMVCHNVEPKRGMMGSPLVAFEDKVFAITKASLKKTNSCRMARLVTVDMVLKLFEWNKKLKGSPFKVGYCQPEGIVKVTKKKQLEFQHAKWKEWTAKSRNF